MWRTLTIPVASRSYSVSSEEQLVKAARTGDQAAFGALVRIHQQRVFQLVGRFFYRPEDVEDVAQETFLRAWHKLSTYRSEAPFEHWLTRLCLNFCFQRLRRHRPQNVELESIPELPMVSHDPTAGLEAKRLLARLAPADRFLLLLLEGEGWSTREIAERLGWSRSNVKVRAHRARKKLIRLMEEESSE